MGRKTDYIPANAGKFNEFFIKMCKYTTQRASGAGAVWKHITKEDLDVLNNGYFAWGTAYGGFLEDPHRPSKIQSRRDAQKTAASFLREFVNRFLRHAPVTDEDRVEMGIPVRDTIKTRIGPPSEIAEFKVKLRDVRQLLLRFKVSGAATKAKPYGYQGVAIRYLALEKTEKAPESIDELVEKDNASRSPHLMTFADECRGKKVYMALQWLNGKFEGGPWSEIESAIVP
ncbi:MAG: hypothetical protein LBI06_03565 [Treponema sp.]|jgi:hypothetical protein|nr:hypothetical protein [Treponema sp.]